MKNALLSILGGTFAAAGLALLVWMVASSWGYAGPLEWAMGLLLLWCVGFGVALIGAGNTSVRVALVRWGRAFAGALRRSDRGHGEERAARMARQR